MKAAYKVVRVQFWKGQCWQCWDLVMEIYREHRILDRKYGTLLTANHHTIDK